MSEDEAIKILKKITPDDLLNCWEGGEKEFEAIETILDLYKKEKEDNKLYKLCMIQDQDFRDRLIEILGVGDNEETILQHIATLVSEKKGIDELKQELLQEKEKNEKIVDKTIQYDKTLEKLQKDTIWKDKIKEKIKEINNRRIEDGQCELALHGFQREAKIDVLKELLEEN